jgi:hypothetical protein
VVALALVALAVLFVVHCGGVSVGSGVGIGVGSIGTVGVICCWHCSFVGVIHHLLVSFAVC